MPTRPVTLLVIGAGGRGTGYATFALQHPDRAQVIGVAEPRDWHRDNLVRACSIPQENVYTNWRQAAERERFADAVIIATQDRMHTEPAIAFAQKGYHILLEKPMAPTEAECLRIVGAATDAGVTFAVCHVLRYTHYTRTLKEIVASGAIGDVVSLQHLEPVGYWHMAHSFVRGSWRNEAESSFMLLAKSCHDLDWIRHIMGVPCEAVASFGSLHHFRPENKPPTAGERCLDCGYEPECPYSAQKIYVERFDRGEVGWPVDVVMPGATREGLIDALKTGPYGRCVYACDNDVVDNQVVSMQFAGGRTATFTMTGFTDMADRRTRVFGTRGMIEGDGRHLRRIDFLTDESTEIDTHTTEGSIRGGHGGGDVGLMDSFIRALAEDDARLVLSGPTETLETHRMVFAAEQARREQRVVRL